MSKFGGMRDLANSAIPFDGLAQHLELEATAEVTAEATTDATAEVTTDAIERNKLDFYAQLSPLALFNKKEISMEPKDVFDKIVKHLDDRNIGWFKKESSSIQSGFHKFSVYKNRKNHEHCVLEYQKLKTVDDDIYAHLRGEIYDLFN